MAIKDELLDELLADYKNPEDLLGRDGGFPGAEEAPFGKSLGRRVDPPPWL